MIFYNPNNGDVENKKANYKPRACFIATQLGGVPERVTKTRRSLTAILKKRRIECIDANSEVTGRDFLFKIWQLIRACPLLVGIICKDTPKTTMANVFYEIGVAQALGKETVIIKADDINMPSNLIRTEYINHDNCFRKKVNKFLDNFFARADYYKTIAEQLEKDPILSIDYLRRAFLISGDKSMRGKVKKLSEIAKLPDRSKNSVESLLADF